MQSQSHADEHPHSRGWGSGYRYDMATGEPVVDADSTYRPRHTSRPAVEHTSAEKTRAETTRIIEKTHISEKTQNLTTLIIGAAASLLILIVTISLMIGNWHVYISSMSLLLQLLVWLIALGVPTVGLVLFAKSAVRGAVQLARETTELLNAQAERRRLNALTTADVAIRNAEAMRIAAEAEQIRRSVIFDPQGNAALINPESGYITQLVGQMREHPNLSSLHYAVKDRPLLQQGDDASEESRSQQELLRQMHIPTFAESLRDGLIGPGQREVLICYELERDEETNELTGGMHPYRDELQNNCTMLLGGASKSGKTTLMSHLAAQEAMMDALYYVIDPHLTHPEKSIAVRLQHLSHAFILPPAMNDADVFAVLHHAEAEAKARLNGQETRYSGRPIVFIVDEALALISRAQRTDNKDIRKLYRDLVLFMRDLGTQYNKYDINGIFATQYVTKDALKLPGANGNLDFRDACQNNTLLRLPANQAQAMRLLDRDQLRGVRQLPVGHGYMGFYDGTIIRMASGNVTMEDLRTVGSLVTPVPSKAYAMGTYREPIPNPGRQEVPETPEEVFTVDGVEDDDAPGEFSLMQQDESTEPLDATRDNITPLQRRSEPVRNPRKKDFTPEQANAFLLKHAQRPNIKWCLRELGLGVEGYYHAARRLLDEREAQREHTEGRA